MYHHLAWNTGFPTITLWRAAKYKNSITNGINVINEYIKMINLYLGCSLIYTAYL